MGSRDDPGKTKGSMFSGKTIGWAAGSLALLLALADSGWADSAYVSWVKRYSSCSGGDYAVAIVVDGSNCTYVAGTSYDANGDDYATVKYDLLGNEVWVRRYNGSTPGSGSDVVHAMTVDGAGNTYVTGESEGCDTSSTSYLDYATVKYSPSGVEQWVARYNGPDNSGDIAMDVAVDGTGNVYVTGGSAGVGTSIDCTTVKYASDGRPCWVARYNGPGNAEDWGLAVAVDDAGDVYVTGASIGAAPDTFLDYLTIKYNPSGGQEWARRYNGPGNGNDQAVAVVVDGSGNVYVTGSSRGDGSSLTDWATVAYDAAGADRWIARETGPVQNNDAATAMAIDDSAHIYVAGTLWNMSDPDYHIVKYDSRGRTEWTGEYGLNNVDQPNGVVVDGSGNVYVTGQSMDYGGTNWDYATVKYDSSGQEQWVGRYHGPVDNGYDWGTAIAIDGQGSVLVTGYSEGESTAYDYATVKYSQVPAIQEPPAPPSWSLAPSAAPNPFCFSTSVAYTVPEEEDAALAVLDVTGRPVRMLAATHQQTGAHRALWDGRDELGRTVPDGVYFCKLRAGDENRTVKLVLQR
jgi:hypothetical protein